MRLLLCAMALASATACNSGEGAPSAPSASPTSTSTVVTFDTFAGFGSGSYTEGGATVTPLSGGWRFNGYGNPGPATVFPGFAYMAPGVPGEIAVTFGGRLFTFAAVDLYSSVTPIPWEFTGYRKTVSVFTATGQQGNTFGRFVTTANPRASQRIDRLVIKLTQPANTSCATCSNNPMGLDNIVIN